MNYEIKKIKTHNSRINTIDFNNIPFGRNFSDHMFRAHYANGEWQSCEIVPLENLSLHPATSALHYGQSIFEGMKAYKSPDGEPQLFRPLMNIKRMNKSAQRMAMAQIPEELFLQALEELVAIDQDWIPTVEGSSLYIRPVLIATEAYVGIKPSDEFIFFIIMCPVGTYYSKPVKVLVDDHFIRAAKGGVGAAKVAGNYGSTLYPVELAREKGYDQILWLDGQQFKYVQEIGTMNVFFIVDGVAITPTLEDGTILDGVTRNSVIQLLNDKDIKVEERKISINELLEASEANVLQDAFGTGTAATISHISEIGYKDRHLILPAVEEREISNYLKDTLEAIRLSKAPDHYNWVHRINVGATI